MIRNVFRRLAAFAMVFVAIPAIASAQTGQVTGTVTSNGAAVAGAQVLIASASLSAETGADGKYTIRGVPVGTYVVKAYRLGFKPKETAGVTVSGGAAATVNFDLAQATVQLGGVVISASRRVEKVTDAPATITRLGDLEIQNSIGNSFAPALKQVKGIEFIQIGVTGVAINARGFNSSFNNRMLMLEDGRIAALVESGLPVGSLTTTSKVDLNGIEVLVGPGSALYGPDASNGVVSLTTKDPKQYQGSTIEVSGGSRNFYDVQGRYAKAFDGGKWAFKATGEYQAVNDFSNTVYYPAVVTGGAPLLEKTPDFRNDVTRGSMALARYFENGGRLIASVGASKVNGIGPTNVGRNQLVNYGYREYQLQYTSPRWFGQVYHTNSVGGKTFQLNGYTQNSARFPLISTDSARKLSAFPGDGRLFAGEIQNNFNIGMLGKTGVALIDNTHITWGGQIRKDRVSSYRSWLSDRKTGQAIQIQQTGGYAQIETPLSEQFRFVASGRYDKHDKYDAQFSPKAALLWTPIVDQTFRVTYNKAFKSPTVLQTDFYFPNFQPFIGVFGNFDGFQIKNAAGTVVNTINPIKPETNNTVELGYKGVIKDKLYVDVALYRTNFKDFQSPLVVIANPLAGAAATTAYNGRTGEKITDAAGGPQVALTYFNVGEAQITGIDAGLKYYFSDKVFASANLSFMKIDTVKRKATDPIEATAFNSSGSRITAGMDFLDVMPGANAGFTARYVNRYDFRSGVNWGTIPGFITLDANYSVKIPDSNARFTLQLQNLFTCVQGSSTPPAIGIGSANQAKYTKDTNCGPGQSHSEMINAPQIGTMVLAGFRWDWR